MFGGKAAIVDAEAEQKADAEARFHEIISLLVAAGYFRARIPALSPFDKVVGGMAWCMTATSVDVDVAFQENATIGQKIKIGEGIERALKFMKCRIPLQAHQIQGLDYAAIFPVVQWLVKQAYAFREEIADATRRLSASQFDRHFELPTDKELAAHRRFAKPVSHELCSCYAPTRRFRPRSQATIASAAVHARRVLVEFGTIGVMASGVGAEAGTDGTAAVATRTASDAPVVDESPAMLQEELKDMAEADPDTELSQSRIVRPPLCTRPRRPAPPSKPALRSSPSVSLLLLRFTGSTAQNTCRASSSTWAPPTYSKLPWSSPRRARRC